MKRRDFIRTSCLSCIGGSALTIALQGCSSAYYAQQVALKENNLVIKKTEFIEIKKEKRRGILQARTIGSRVIFYTFPGQMEP